MVTPFAGVWIEIQQKKKVLEHCGVTPFAGVWIEIILRKIWNQNEQVTPFAGVWIEITNIMSCIPASIASLPSRECGLKSLIVTSCKKVIPVTPFAGVWIEIAALQPDLREI